VWEYLKVSEKTFWDRLSGADWWASLSWTKQGPLILYALRQHWPDSSIFLVTSPACDPVTKLPLPGCIDGKMEWVSKHMPEFSDRIVFTHNKWLLSTPGTLLIDDNDKQIDTFLNRGLPERSPGFAMTVPARWNRLHSYKDVDFPEHLSGWIRDNVCVVRGMEVLEQSRQGEKALADYREEREKISA
jgi:hypothetical protein